MKTYENRSPWTSEVQADLIKTIAILGPWWHHTMNPEDTMGIYQAALISDSAAMDALVRAGYILVQGRAMPINEIAK